MSFLTEKWRERSRQAGEAAEAGRFSEALHFAAEAARCAFDLAESMSGEMARAYLEDANGWVELVERLKKRASSQATAPRTDKGSEREGDAQASKWLTRERPKERFADVAGLEDVKKIVFEDVINATKYADAYRELKMESGGGALMYGPPGNGKTLIARAIAGELDAPFFNVSGALIKDKFVGETEKNMRRLFEEACACERAVVFIDEIQSLLAKRSADDKVSAVDEFLVMTDGFAKRKNALLLLGATNYPWMIDPAAFRRFKNLVYVGQPDAAACKRIFELQFEGAPTAEPLPFDRSAFAARAKGFSGADVARAASAAKKLALRRMIDAGAERPLLRASDLETAIEETKPSVSPSMIQKYREWERAFYGGDPGAVGND